MVGRGRGVGGGEKGVIVVPGYNIVPFQVVPNPLARAESEGGARSK